MKNSHISAIDILEAVLLLKTGQYEVPGFSERSQSISEIHLSEIEVKEEISDLFLPLFRSKNSLEVALFVLSASYQAETVGFLADQYLQILKGGELC